jgi:hypothetical protein
MVIGRCAARAEMCLCTRHSTEAISFLPGFNNLDGPQLQTSHDTGTPTVDCLKKRIRAEI